MNLLVMLGVVVDPTSSGVAPTPANAMTYEQPNCVKCTDPDTGLSQDGGDAGCSHRIGCRSESIQKKNHSKICLCSLLREQGYGF